MTTEQVKDWFKKAEQYFESETQNDNETEFKEKLRLIEILREWGRKHFLTSILERTRFIRPMKATRD